MSKILQKSNIVVQDHKAIIHKQFDEIIVRLEEKVNKVDELENELQQTKDFYENIIDEIEKKISALIK